MSHEIKTTSKKIPLLRALLFVAGMLSLAVIYVFQQFNFFHFIQVLAGISSTNPNVIFIVNKTLRLILNDLACLMIIAALFQGKKYLKVAFVILLAEVFVLLPLYFFLKLTLEGDSELSSPLLSQIHRLIVNPMLMILVIISFFFQRLKNRDTVKQ